MLRTVVLGAAAGLMALAAASASFAQGNFQAPTAAQIEAGKTFVSPKIGMAYAEKLAQQPDFQGQWEATSPDPARIGRFMFDPSNTYIPYETPPGLAEFGPKAGAYVRGIPYKPEYQKQYMDQVARTEAGMSIDTFGLCRPFGFPRLMAGAVSGFDIMQNVDLIAFHNGYSDENRRVFLDGRPHPSVVGVGDSDARTYSGHSVGHWEGDTLVVETTNILAGFYDQTSPPYSDQIKVVERMRLIDTNIMQNEMTITDPVMLTRPWVVTRYYRRLSANQNGPRRYHNLEDRPCKESIDFSQGFQSVILPQEIEAKAAEEAAKGAR